MRGNFVLPEGTREVKLSEYGKRAQHPVPPVLRSLSTSSVLPKHHLLQPLHPPGEVPDRRVLTGILRRHWRRASPLGFAELLLAPQMSRM